MATDISSFASNPAVRPAVPAAVQTLQTAKPAEQAPAPKVTPIPKVEINFDPERSHQKLQEAINKLNDMMVSGGRGLNFSMDEKLGRPIIYVKNTQTGEIVRQIPNEVIVQLAHNIEDFKGLLLNQAS